jgi:gentisate 1,2-dioxygenase
VPAATGPAGGHSPKYRYPGEATRRLLDAVAPGPDGARTIRYVNPLTGGAVMATLDCYATRLVRGTPTRARRVTHNAICLVVAGEGRSTVGEQTFEWARHDVFTVPHWTWATHESRGPQADLFVVTDRAVYERLELFREELR